MGFGVTVAVPDGIAVACDSRMDAALSGGPETMMSDTQQKIVQMSRFVAVLAVEPYKLDADIQLNLRSTLESIRPDFRREATLEAVLDELPGRFSSAAGVEKEAVPTLRVIGYSRETRSVQLVDLEGLDVRKPLRSTLSPGLNWFGFNDVADRLIKAQTKLGDRTESEAIEYVIPYPVMSLQDAIDLAENLVQTTATFGKFVKGYVTDGDAKPLNIKVGGPIQSAIVSSDGFQWVKRPEWTRDPPSR